MDMAVHIFHAPQTAWQSDFPDTIGGRFDQKRTKKFGEQGNKNLGLEHGAMVALSVNAEKAGKSSGHARPSGSAKFSRLFNPAGLT